MRDLAATGGMADVDGVREIEMRRQRREVVGIVVHVVAVAGLGGSPVAPPVVSDDAIDVKDEEHNLGVPVIGRDRPSVAEHDGLAASPVLVEDLRAIGGGDRAHEELLPKGLGVYRRRYRLRVVTVTAWDSEPGVQPGRLVS